MQCTTHKMHMYLGQSRNNCVHGYACGIVILQQCRARSVLQLLTNYANLCSDAYVFRAVWGSTQTRRTRRSQFMATYVSQADWCHRPTSALKLTCRRFSFVLLKLCRNSCWQMDIECTDRQEA